MSASPIEPTTNIEARLTRIESDVAHLDTTMGEMRLDIREIIRKIDALTPLSVTNDLRADFRELRGDFRELRGEFGGQRGEFGDLRGDFSGMRREFGGLRGDFRDLSRKVDRQLYYLIGSQASLLTIVLGTMAKGFHWL